MHKAERCVDKQENVLKESRERAFLMDYITRKLTFRFRMDLMKLEGEKLEASKSSLSLITSRQWNFPLLFSCCDLIVTRQNHSIKKVFTFSLLICELFCFPHFTSFLPLIPPMPFSLRRSGNNLNLFMFRYKRQLISIQTLLKKTSKLCAG